MEATFVEHEAAGWPGTAATAPRPDTSHPAVTVVATDVDATAVALRAACDLVRPFAGRIRVLAPMVICFPAQLDDPPACYAHLLRKLLSDAGGDADIVEVSVWPCRDAHAVLSAVLNRPSIVVVGVRGLLGLRARRLARWLTSKGHRVLLAWPEPRREPPALITEWPPRGDVR